MRLKSVKLLSFRGYRTTTFIPIDEAMTACWLSGIGLSTTAAPTF